MVMNKNLISLWNFDTVTGSDGGGEFIVDDVVGENYGMASEFNTDSNEFIYKEYVTAEKQLYFDTINTDDTINIGSSGIDSAYSSKLPTSTNLILEKSMYQNISDEMLNMFLDVYDYTFNLFISSNKYSKEYKRLEKARKYFFTKILNKPDLEKYIEFYRWADSSLEYMLNQLKPENSNNINYIKNTIESHVLERSKVKHRLPLTYVKNKTYESNIKVLDNNSLSVVSSKTNDGILYVEKSIDNIVSTDNVLTRNYKNNYDIVQQTGGNGKRNITSTFSSADGSSDKYRMYNGEYSIFNSLLNKSKKVIEAFNEQESEPIGTQGKDNNFLNQNIPYTASNYYITGPTYTVFPKREILFRKRTNLLIDESSNRYENSYDIVEPCIEFNSPQHFKIKFDNSDLVDVYAPYSNQINDFSYRNKKKSFSRLENIYAPTIKNRTAVSKNTFFNVLQNSSSISPTVEYFENLNVVFPRQDKVGLAEIRTKPFYDETNGASRVFYYEYYNLNLFSTSPTKLLPWTFDSYNNPSHKIRSFWKDHDIDRLRTRGIDWDKVEGDLPDSEKVKKHYGSYNCYDYVNKANLTSSIGYTFEGSDLSFLDLCVYKHDLNIYNSMYSMDSYNDVVYTQSSSYIILSSSKEVCGDLTPYSHINNYKLSNLSLFNNLNIQPKPQFIHNLFLNKANTNKSNIEYVYNKSYQDPIDCNIKSWYDSYENFRRNIKSTTQTFSTIPEFVVSNHTSLIKDNSSRLYKTLSVVKLPETGYYVLAKNIPNVKSEDVINFPIPSHLKIYGNEKQDLLRYENYKVDLKNFIDKKSNKIKFKIRVAKKILPYNGFYPQQRTMQIAGLYNDVFLTDTGIVTSLEKQEENPGNRNSYVAGVQNTLAATQFLFSPGILFNSIKSGIAVDWPLVTSSAVSDNYIENKGSYSVKDIHYRMPFESLIKPEFYLNKLIAENKNACITYLDPTHQSKDADYFNKARINADPQISYISSFQLKKFDDSINKKLYHIAINNFLSETVNFFLQNKKLKHVKSNTFDTTIPVISGSVYTMDLVISKNSNFSMFNTEISGAKQNFYIPYESLFGPPVQYGNEYDHKMSVVYYPYIPPYMQDAESSRLRMVYTASSDEDNLYNIMKKTKIYPVDNIYSITNPNGLKAETSYINRMDLRSCMNLDMLTSEENGFTWYIQAKFESPLINLSKCSYSEVVESASEIKIKPD